MKRASQTLFLTLLVVSGLALWLNTRAAPREDPPALPAPELGAAADPIPAPLLEREPAADGASASERAPASNSVGSGSGSPDGCRISGWVSRIVEKQKQGLGDVPVKLWAAAADGSFPAESSPCAESRTGEMGSFRFRELARGSYFVAVEPQGRTRRLARLELAEADDWETVEFVLGTARVEGLAWAFGGDARPTLELEATSPHRRAEQCWPDAEHGFAFLDLPAGSYTLRARWRTNAPGSWREESSRIELADGQRQSIEVGSPDELPHWRGSVHVAGGELPRPDALLRFEASEARIERPRLGDPRPDQVEQALPAAEALALPRMQDDPKLVVRAGLDPQGRFDVALPARQWKALLEVDALSHRTRLLGQESLANGHVSLDLVCPGSRVRGRIRGPGGATVGNALRLAGTRITGGDGDTYCAGALDARGGFVLDGLEQGSWEFRPRRLPKGWTGEAVPLRIGQTGRVLELELRVQRP